VSASLPPVRKLSGSWTRPSAPKRVNRPSWIGTLHRGAFDAALAEEASSSAAPMRLSKSAPKIPSVPPNMLSSKPPASASSAALLAHAQGAPSPMIASAREVELEGEVAALHGEIAKLESMLMSVKAAVIEESEPEIVRLALAVAKRIVGREVTADPKVLHRWIEEGTKALPNRGEIAIVASPDVADELGNDAAHEIITDAMLPHGTCELREGEAMVSVGLDAKMAAMSDALGVDEQAS
jgi:hypothetical protein